MVRFTENFQLFTGYFPHTTGILKNADAWKKSWVSNLADVGYHCVNVGKILTDRAGNPADFRLLFFRQCASEKLHMGRYAKGRFTRIDARWLWPGSLRRPFRACRRLLRRKRRYSSVWIIGYSES